jgi:hypothetical protein
MRNPQESINTFRWFFFNRFFQVMDISGSLLEAVGQIAREILSSACQESIE